MRWRARAAAGAAAGLAGRSPWGAAAAVHAGGETLPERAEALFVAGRFDAADGEYLHVLAVDPGSQHALAQRGYVARLSNRPADAAAPLSRALQLQPDDRVTRRRGDPRSRVPAPPGTGRPGVVSVYAAAAAAAAVDAAAVPTNR
jgi:hypothetical protein